MKTSKMLDQIAQGAAFSEKTLIKCTSLRLIVRDEYFTAIQHYLSGVATAEDGFLLQDLANCLREVGA
jgi:hypothetical protein